MSYTLKAFSKDGNHAVILHDDEDGLPYVYNLTGGVFTYTQSDTAPDAEWKTDVDEPFRSINEARQYIRGFVANGK